MDGKRQLLRHFLATLAYRTQKALRGAPADFAQFRVAPGVRTPHELVRHMSRVLDWTRSFFESGRSRPPRLDHFDDEVARFHQTLEDLGKHLKAGTPLTCTTPEKLLQGPLADAMTHAGQLALLRRLAGDPIPPENFHSAQIDRANLGPGQAQPADPDMEWYEAEEEP